ncbi:hypothetical protein [Rikenella microfusus]|uniref:hypothetical protein n=1 Tax=Rikenella microfusus TaxID=28139 RepID=UPI00248E0BF4|nr:hypothetical protein [Rikenella microfusus]
MFQPKNFQTIKQITKTLVAIGGALLITGGAVVNFLQTRKPPLTPQEEFTLANIEARSILIKPEWDNPYELPMMLCGTISYLVCRAPCPFCGQEIKAVNPGGPFASFAGGKCGNCKANL